MSSNNIVWRSAGENILASLWVGGLWVSGYLVAPLLFSVLDDRQLAGMVAGRIFQLMSYVGLIAGGLLLISVMLRSGQGWVREWRAWCLLGMLALVIIGAFVLQPMMQELKSVGIETGSDNAARFGMLHGISSVLYLITSLLGLWLIAMGVRSSATR